MHDKLLESIYTTVFSLKFSPDGNELAVGDNFGHVSVFKLSTLLSADYVDKPKLPHLKVNVDNSSSLYCLENTDDHLICAPLNEIVGYKWKDLSQSKGSVKSAFRLRLPSSNNIFGSNIETNSLVHEDNKIYAACGNGEIYVFDLETNQLLSKFAAAHDLGIYQIVLKNNNQEILSASEDGHVKIWDIRSRSNVATISPAQNSLCSRPNLGKHINCVVVDDDNWLICGGGPKLSMWHLRSLKPMSVFEESSTTQEHAAADNFMPNVVRVHDNQVITGGNSNRLMFYTFESKLKNEIATSSSMIYDAVVNKHSKANRILCVAGSGVSVDVCSNMSYRAMSFQLQ